VRKALVFGGLVTGIVIAVAVAGKAAHAQGQTDLQVRIDAPRVGVIPGGRVQISYVITNNGPQTAMRGWELQVGVPSAFKGLSTSAGCDQSMGGPVFRCGGTGTLNVRESVTVTVGGYVPDDFAGDLTFTGTVKPTGMVDPKGSNDNDSLTVYVGPLPTGSPTTGPPRPQPRPTGPILPATGPPGRLEGLVGIGIAELVLGMVLLMPPRRRA
jgi:hypothetical protein